MVDGATPLLVGRPILQALQVCMSHATSKMTIMGGEETDVPLGERGEYLLQLDDGVEADPHGEHVAFDYITDETLTTINNYENLEDYIHIQEYLATTSGTPPSALMPEDETALEAKERDESEVESPSTMAEDEDATAVRKPITDKLVKTLHMNFNMFSRQRRSKLEKAMHSYDKGKLVFWEVYCGSGNLSQVLQSHGWEVKMFDINTGWDFEKSDHRRKFLEMLDKECPDFVWLSPPCTAWSSLQFLNVATEAERRALEEKQNYQEATNLKFTKRVFQKQQREGRHSGFEHPLRASSWKTRTIQNMPGYDAELDQCQYGCTLPDAEGYDQYVKKPTLFRCTDEQMALELGAKCPGDH